MKKEEVERLRTLAHEAPMNPVFETHLGHRHLGNHSMAWAYKSMEYVNALNEYNRDQRQTS